MTRVGIRKNILPIVDNFLAVIKIETQKIRIINFSRLDTRRLDFAHKFRKCRLLVSPILEHSTQGYAESTQRLRPKKNTLRFLSRMRGMIPCELHLDSIMTLHSCR